MGGNLSSRVNTLAFQTTTAACAGEGSGHHHLGPPELGRPSLSESNQSRNNSGAGLMRNKDGENLLGDDDDDDDVFDTDDGPAARGFML